MKSNIKTILTISGLVISANALSNEWNKCRAITNNDQRLACYDQLVDLHQDVKTPVNKVLSLSQSEEAEAQKHGISPASAVPQASADSNSTSIVNPDVIPTEKTFGIEQKFAENNQLDEIRTSYAGTFKGWEAKQKITFANGQVWQITDNSSAYYHIENPTVIIERGMFGGYVMRVEGLNKSPKVKRIK